MSIDDVYESDTEFMIEHADALEADGWCQHDADVVDRCRSIADRLEALEAVAVAARRAVDAIDEKSWWEASPIVAELNAALTALGSPTEDQRP